MLPDQFNEPGFNAYATLLGIHFTEVGGGTAHCVLDITSHHFHPGGVVHGGVAYSMADSAMAICLLDTLDDAHQCATIEIKISYLSAVREGRLRCQARVIKKGKRIAFMEAEIHSENGLIAIASGTFAMLHLD